MATTAGTFADSPVELRVEFLLRTARDGNDLAFEEIVRLYRHEIYRITLGLLGNAEEATLITHRVFVSFFRSMSRMSGDRDLRPWLRRMAVNRCYDVLRHRKHNERPEFRLMPGCMLGDEPLKPSDLANIVQQAMDTLPTRERTALVLTGQLGYSSDEAGRAMGCDAPTVRHLALAARERLRALFLPNAAVGRMS